VRALDGATPAQGRTSLRGFSPRSSATAWATRSSSTIADVGPLAIAPSVFAKLPYNSIKDLAAVSQVAVLPFVLAATPSVPARTVPELIELAKAKPGELNYASVGNGTAVHLATELFKQLAGIEMTHVPYRGSAPALTDLVAGRVSVMFVNVLSAMSFVNSGQLRALAIGTPQRSGAFPDVATFAEIGMPDFEAGVWFGVLAPAGTPGPIIQRLNTEIARALASPDLKEKLAQQGAEVVVSTPEQFAAKIRSKPTSGQR
jgi:tripartite-type tricarboxylate transporter receptor subunit TctC